MSYKGDIKRLSVLSKMQCYKLITNEPEIRNVYLCFSLTQIFT